MPRATLHQATKRKVETPHTSPRNPTTDLRILAPGLDGRMLLEPLEV